MGNVLSAAALVSFGVLEGYVMTMTGVASPRFFRDQMTFSSFAIMKFFLGCVGSSMLSQGLMNAVAPGRFGPTRTLTNAAIPYWRSVPGCFVLGVGMYMAGSGPTMIGSQLFMGISSAPYILLGALAGGAAFGILEPRMGLDFSVSGDERLRGSLDGRFGVKYEAIAIPAGIALLGVACELELLSPHAVEATRAGLFPAFSKLSPVWAALAVGFNQVPIRIIKKTGQGGTTSIMNLVSTLTGGLISPNLKIRTLADAYQFLFVYAGMGSGAWLWCNLHAPDYVAPEGYSPLASAVGAFLSIFGARIAGGCTCGHGVSGVSELSLSSMAAAASIFAGGISAGMVHAMVER